MGTTWRGQPGGRQRGWEFFDMAAANVGGVFSNVGGEFYVAAANVGGEF